LPTNNFWIDALNHVTGGENIRNYYLDGSYYLAGVCPGRLSNNAQFGDPVAYILSGNGTFWVHSAYVAYGATELVSKWGHAGVYRHSINDVPQEYKDGLGQPALGWLHRQN
jgi:hypothetical protein